MDDPEASSAVAPSPQPRSRQRWLILFVLLAAAISIGYSLRPLNQKGQWLVGCWNNVETYSDDSRVEREWIFEPQGRVSCMNQFTIAGDRPSKSIQKFSGQWSVHDGSLLVRMDRPAFRSLVQSGTHAYVAVHNAVTGSKMKTIDHESSEGTLVQVSPDQFTVTWIDPSAPDKVQSAQTWSRVP